MSLLHLLYLVLPAVVSVHTLFGERATRWDLVAGFGLAMLVLGWGGYAVALLTLDGYQHLTFLLLNILFLWSARRQGSAIAGMLRRLLARGWPSAESWLVAVLILAGFLFALYSYQTDAHCNSCLHWALCTAIGVDFGKMGDLPFADSLLFSSSGEREGAYALVAPFAFLHGFFGLRLFYATSIAFSGVFGYLLARRNPRCTSLRRLFAASLFLGFPFFSDLLWIDNNLVTLFAASAMTYVAHCRGVRARYVGAFFGILVATRHESVLCLLGPLLVYAETNGIPSRGILGRRAAAEYAGAIGLFLLPVFLHHAFAFGSPFAFEGFLEYDAHEHSFLGVAFKLHAMLNYPFYPEVVRTPFNPLPTLLLHPVWLVSRLGLAVSALVLIGAVASLGRPRKAIPYLAWGLPYAMMLMLNENWMQVEKMGILAPIVPLVLMTAVNGLDAVARLPRWSLRLGALAGAGALVYAGICAAKTVQVPADPRFYRQYPWMLSERREYLDTELGLLKVGLAPSPEWRSTLHTNEPWQELWQSFLHPAYENRVETPREQLLGQIMPGVYASFLRQRKLAPFRESETNLGPTVSLEIDLTRPWVAGRDWIRKIKRPESAGSFVFDLAAEPEGRAYRRFPLPWDPQHTVTLTLFRRGETAYVALSGPNPYERNPNPDELHPPPYDPVTEPENTAPTGGKFCVIVPEKSGIQFVEVLSLDPSRIYRWVLPSAKDPVRIQGPTHWRHS